MDPIAASAEPNAIERVEMENGRVEDGRMAVVAWSCRASILGPAQSSPGRRGKTRTSPLAGNTTSRSTQPGCGGTGEGKS